MKTFLRSLAVLLLFSTSVQATSSRIIQGDVFEGKSAPRNYVNGHFENGLGGWTLFNTTLTSGLPTGVVGGGAGSLNALARTTTTPLHGAGSLQVSSAGAVTAGQGFISSAFTIDRKDAGKVLTFSVPYEVIAGAANLDFSGTSTQSLAVYIYDVTNSAWIQPSGFRGMNQSKSPGVITGSFQSSVTAGQQYQLAVLALNATGGAITVNFDEISVGPQAIVYGYAGTDFVADSRIVLTNTGTTTGTVYSRKSGDSLEVYGTMQTGTQTASVPFFQLTGLAMDPAKLAAAPGAQVGDWTIITTNGAAQVTPGGSGYGGPMFFDGTNTDKVYFTNQVQSSTFVKRNANALLATNDPVSFRFRIPIVGWSSNAQLSQDADTRVVAAVYSVSAGTVAPGATTPINFDTKTLDTHGAVTTGVGTWKFTAPVTGPYQLLTTVSANGASNLFIYKNGSAFAQIGTATASADGTGSAIVPMNAGDYIDIRLNNAVTLFGGTGTANQTIINISKISGPSVIAANESVNCRYAGSSTAISGAAATILFGTKSWDTHNAYNPATGIFTAPVSGKYAVKTHLALTESGASAGQSAFLTAIQAGSSTQAAEDVQLYNTGGTTIMLGIADDFYMLAGDTLKVQASSTMASPSIVSNVNRNWISISKVGNF